MDAQIVKRQDITDQSDPIAKSTEKNRYNELKLILILHFQPNVIR